MFCQLAQTVTAGTESKIASSWMCKSSIPRMIIPSKLIGTNQCYIRQDPSSSCAVVAVFHFENSTASGTEPTSTEAALSWCSSSGTHTHTHTTLFNQLDVHSVYWQKHAICKLILLGDGKKFRDVCSSIFSTALVQTSAQPHCSPWQLKHIPRVLV